MRALMHRDFNKVIFFLGAALLFSACGNSPSTSNSDSSSSPAESPSVEASPLTGFERDLQFIRNGQYAYIWVFSRQDGKPLDAEDSRFLRTNAPQVVDWASYDGKKAVAGTNFNLEEGNLELLKKRFVVEDYSNR